MQKRHLDRTLYFKELAETSRKYYIPYIEKFKSLNPHSRILEIGCGDGGNLLPFAKLGCYVRGIDIATCRILDAQKFFQQLNYNASFEALDFMKMEEPTTECDKYDVILLHDVIEHIPMKLDFLKKLKKFLKVDGILFVGFPAWQMPFGGHQQICRGKVLSHTPFIHLLPNTCYRKLLSLLGEKEDIIKELMDIKYCKTTIEYFEKTIKICDYQVVSHKLWFINPHYEEKFNLTPRPLYHWISHLKYIRNFFSTSCWYLLKLKT